VRVGHILVEGPPHGLDARTIGEGVMAEGDGVARVDHIHAWGLNEARPMVTLDVYADPGACPETLRRAVKAQLTEPHERPHAPVRHLGLYPE